MSRIIVLIALGLLALMPIAAQDDTVEAPDYQVRNTAFSLSPDETEIVVTFAIYNAGGDASQIASAQLVELADSSNIIAEMTFAPVEGRGGTQEGIPLRFPVTAFDPGETAFLNVIVTLDEEDISTTLNNAAPIEVTVPNYDPALLQDNGGSAEQTSDPATGDETEATPLEDLQDEIRAELWWLDIGIDLENTQHVAILAGFGAVLLLLALIVRLFLGLFRRSPAFGNWQPPYATMPPLDPNSTFGRRQAWQQHAQNNSIPTPCQGTQVHPRKVMLGMDGAYLSGWKITALRMTQYDMYGRVSRSQVMASGAQVKRINRTARRLHKLDNRQIARRVRPVAKSLAKQFKKRVNKRSAMLPIALDVRLRGTHGEVRILFELYECQNGQPRRIDYWEPEMTVVGKTIYESYTFTVFGQSGGETFKAFRRRLAGDIERVLTEMFNTYERPQSSPAPVGPSANTLTGTQPMNRVDANGATPATDAAASRVDVDDAETVE